MKDEGTIESIGTTEMTEGERRTRLGQRSVELFNMPLAVEEKYRRVNQYQ